MAPYFTFSRASVNKASRSDVVHEHQSLLRFVFEWQSVAEGAILRGSTGNSPMVCLQDPRSLEPPDYWELVWDSFAQFCDYVADGLKEQYGVTVEPMDIENNFYAQREYQWGDLDEAIRCIAEYDLFWNEEDATH